MHKIRQAFSLIELMVVIAIVGVLAAIAVPVYQSYIVSARLSSAMAIIDGIVDQMTTFAAQHGRFANAYDLGLTTRSSPTYLGYWQADSPSAVIPNASAVGMGDWSNNCGATGWVQVDFDSLAPFGLPAGSSGSILCSLWNYKGTINNFCYYAFSNVAGTLPGSYIPGVLNRYSNTTSGATIYTNYVNSTTYNSATCM